MPSKTLIFIFMFVGSIIGGYIPVLFGDDILSFWSIITSAIGSLIGIWVAVKISSF